MKNNLSFIFIECKFKSIDKIKEVNDFYSFYIFLFFNVKK